MRIAVEHEVFERTARIGLDGIVLDADLAFPQAAKGIVLFAHGSGSSRLSPRNRAVASRLHDARIATLLLDLLTIEEEKAERVRAANRSRAGHL